MELGPLKTYSIRALQDDVKINQDNTKLFEGHDARVQKNLTCQLSGCTNHRTLYKGPGQSKLCREHQLKLREYGGPGRLDRPWTFWKKDKCETCGHDPSKNPLIKHEPKQVRKILGSMMLDVDHIDSTLGDRFDIQSEMNNPKNLQTLCKECHSIKTLYEGDHY
jgi:hypothetical protein